MLKKKMFSTHELASNYLCYTLMIVCNCSFVFDISDVPKVEALILNRASQMPFVPKRDTQRCKKKKKKKKIMDYKPQ